MGFINISVKKHKITPQDVAARNDPGESKAPVYNKGRHSFEWREVGVVGVGGDMRKDTYDRTDSGVVDNSEALEGSTLTQVRDHAPKGHNNTQHIDNFLTTCDKYSKEFMDLLGIDAAGLEDYDLAGVRTHVSLTHGNGYHSDTLITTCDKYSKGLMDLLGVDAATLGGKALGVGVGNIAFYDANGRVADVTKVKGTTVDATDIGAGKLLAYNITLKALEYEELTYLVPAIDTDGKLILTGAAQIGTKTSDLANLWDKTTRIVTSDLEATEFNQPNKIPTLDASIFLDLSQMVGNVPGLNAAGDLVLTAVGTQVGDLTTLWDKSTKLVTSDIDDAEFNVASKLLKLDASAKVAYAQMPAIGGTATLLVAAVDSQNTKKADYVCDGIADQDTFNTAIGSLPASGGSVVLLEGNYILSDKVAIGISNVTLRGQGKGTKLYLANGIQTNLIEVTGVSGVAIDNMYLDGTTAAADAGVNWNQCGILFNNVDESKIMNCWIQSNKRSGILLYNGSTQNEVSSCICKENCFYGIVLLTSVSHNSISSNICAGNHLDGILVSTASTNNSVTGNTCNDNTSNGIYIYSTSNTNSIFGNTCQSNSNNGITLDVTEYYNTVSGNTCVANGQHGMALYSTSHYNVISGNNCNGNTSNGIYLETDSYNTIVANTCNGNTLRGILLDDGCTDNTVTGNTCNSNTKGGIKLVDSSNDNSITGNVCYDNGNASNLIDGISIDGSSNNNTISGNTSNNNTKDGINIQGSSYNTITGNTCVGNTRYGAFLTLCTSNTISSNTCISNHTEDIHLVSNADYNNIQGNICRAGIRAPYPDYGINISTLSCDGNMVTNNDIYNDNFALGSLNDASGSTITAAGNRT